MQPAQVLRFSSSPHRYGPRHDGKIRVGAAKPMSNRRFERLPRPSFLKISNPGSFTSSPPLRLERRKACCALSLPYTKLYAWQQLDMLVQVSPDGQRGPKLRRYLDTGTLQHRSTPCPALVSAHSKKRTVRHHHLGSGNGRAAATPSWLFTVKRALCARGSDGVIRKRSGDIESTHVKAFNTEIHGTVNFPMIVVGPTRSAGVRSAGALNTKGQLQGAR
ncbi:hypothetical protein FA95DRAFT_107232 [Auriscalpium vulgare]|uniref:Uncharacterized protein n=1 Tax=Auriscalpium vulgare TaxID=40419 RepID=A0ACB8S7N0_9AGAM|nr:hypothetical protein FA95DRAFT_107232 [Auriscalpium vulgare]